MAPLSSALRAFTKDIPGGITSMIFKILMAVALVLALWYLAVLLIEIFFGEGT